MRIEEIVSRVWGIEEPLLYTGTRKRNITEARQVLMWYEKTRMGSTFEKTGKKYARNHSTACHAIKVVKALVSCDKEYRRKLKEVFKLKKQLN